MHASSAFAKFMQEAHLKSCRKDLADKETEITSLVAKVDELCSCVSVLEEGKTASERHAQLEGHRDALGHNLGITEQQLAIANQQLQAMDRLAQSKAAQLASKSHLADHLISLVQTGMYQLTDLHRRYVAVAVLAGSKSRLVDVLNGRLRTATLRIGDLERQLEAALHDKDCALACNDDLTAALGNAQVRLGPLRLLCNNSDTYLKQLVLQKALEMRMDEADAIGALDTSAATPKSIVMPKRGKENVTATPSTGVFPNIIMMYPLANLTLHHRSCDGMWLT